MMCESIIESPALGRSVTKFCMDAERRMQNSAKHADVIEFMLLAFVYLFVFAIVGVLTFLDVNAACASVVSITFLCKVRAKY